MNRNNEINNTDEFLKLFPEKKNVHEKDLILRKELQELEKSGSYELISSDLKIELNRAMVAVKTYKSNVLRGKMNVEIYENAVNRLGGALSKATKEFDQNPEYGDLTELNYLEKALLKLPLKSLKNLLQVVINKTGILLNEETQDEKFDLVSLTDLHDELKEKYNEIFRTLPLLERQKVGKVLQSLVSLKSNLGKGTSVKSYGEKVNELKQIILSYF